MKKALLIAIICFSAVTNITNLWCGWFMIRIEGVKLQCWIYIKRAQDNCQILHYICTVSLKYLYISENNNINIYTSNVKKLYLHVIASLLQTSICHNFHKRHTCATNTLCCTITYSPTLITFKLNFTLLAIHISTSDKHPR